MELAADCCMLVTEKGVHRHKRRTGEGAGGEGSPGGLRGSPDEWRKAGRDVNEQKSDEW